MEASLTTQLAWSESSSYRTDNQLSLPYFLSLMQMTMAAYVHKGLVCGRKITRDHLTNCLLKYHCNKKLQHYRCPCPLSACGSLVSGQVAASHRRTSVSIEAANTVWARHKTTSFYLFGQHYRAGCYRSTFPKLTWLGQELDFIENLCT